MKICRLACSFVLSLALGGCTYLWARSTYTFAQWPSEPSVWYEPGAEDMAKSIAANIDAAIGEIEAKQFRPFKNRQAIRVYVFQDRRRYARFSYASVQTRASATTSEIYISPKIREKIETLPNIVLHELSHVHIRQYTGTWRYVTHIPGWFLEGLAVVVSGGGGAEQVSETEAITAMHAREHFQARDQGRLLGHKTANDYGLKPHMYYRQAGMFVAYLQKLDPLAFRQALVALQSGDRFNRVWVRFYKMPIGAIWQRYLNQWKAASETGAFLAQ